LKYENHNNFFNAKFEEKSYNFEETNQFQEEFMDEIQERTKLEKEYLLKVIFHQMKNDEYLKPVEFENQKNYEYFKCGCWNIFCAIDYQNEAEEDEKKEIWSPGWGLIIRNYQKVEVLLVLIDFNSILINFHSILISRYAIDSTRTLFMDTTLIIFKFIKKYLNVKYLKTVGKDVEVVMKTFVNDKRKFLN
jgi:hypothetical protein